MTLTEELETELADLRDRGLLRSRPANALAPGMVDVCSNDYLGYAGRGVSRETLAGEAVGAGASRLIFGTRPVHASLEREIGDWLRTPDALLFSSGYAANVGVVSALARPGDLIASDALNHASLIDGCRLSRARVVVYPHLDLYATEQALQLPVEGRRWVVTESYFSMDADSPDLRALRALCDKYRAGLVVDEAHALGVFGPEGRGLAALAGVQTDCLVGTLGKALGAQGAFAAGSTALVEYLWNRARSFVFSTATSPVLSALALAHVRDARRDDNARTRLTRLAEALELELQPIRHRLPEHRMGPIFPILLGSPDRAVHAAAALAEHGFRAQAIRPPTVAPGACRLRVTVNAGLSESTVLDLGRALRGSCAP